MTPVRLGMVRLTDAAPVVWAATQGLFAAEGVDVQVSVEPSWANVADKLAWGVLDGAVMLPPLAFAMLLGLRGPALPLVVPAGISRHGNAVTLARRLAQPVLAGGRPDPVEAARRLRAVTQPGLRLGVVHAFSTHDLLLRLFLERGGIDVARVGFVVVPPADMPGALAEGRVDGFCAGAPWGAVAARDGVGLTVAVSSAIQPGHAEKCLAVRAAFAEREPAAVRAVVRALAVAGAAVRQGRAAVAQELAAPAWLGVNAGLIAASLPGGAGGEVDVSEFTEAAGAGDARWFVRQMARWREMPADAETRAVAAYDWAG